SRLDCWFRGSPRSAGPLLAASVHHHLCAQSGSQPRRLCAPTRLSGRLWRALARICWAPFHTRCGSARRGQPHSGRAGPRLRAIAEKLETERRAAQELDIAKQVQARLFPQTLPRLKTLEYAGICRQAKQVGGDYYDFLDLGSERLGFVIGDISGKGIAAALL